MKIFDVEEGNVKLNENCYLIPELKVLADKYEDAIPVFTYIHFLTHPESPYHNLPDDEKNMMVSQDAGGDFDLDDEDIDIAIEKLKTLYTTPVQEYYEGQKNSMHMVGRFLKNLSESSITTGRDGSLSEIVRMQKEAGKTLESFLKVEKLWREQVQQKLRGNAEQGEY